MPTAPTPAELPQPIKKELTAPNHQCHKPGRQPETLASGRDHLGTLGDIIPECRATSCRNTRATSSESAGKRIRLSLLAQVLILTVRYDHVAAGAKKPIGSCRLVQRVEEMPELVADCEAPALTV